MEQLKKILGDCCFHYLRDIITIIISSKIVVRCNAGYGKMLPDAISAFASFALARLWRSEKEQERVRRVSQEQLTF